MTTIRLEKEEDSVWIDIDNSSVEISAHAFTQLCYGMVKFCESEDTVKEIRLDVADDDYDPFEEEE